MWPVGIEPIFRQMTGVAMLKENENQAKWKWYSHLIAFYGLVFWNEDYKKSYFMEVITLFTFISKAFQKRILLVFIRLSSVKTLTPSHFAVN